MMPRVLYRFVELSVTERPHFLESLDWLHPDEQGELDRIRAGTRRDQWLLGRRAVKELILEQHPRDALPMARIAVQSRDGAGRGVPPSVSMGGRTLPWQISISHTVGAALVGLCQEPRCTIGVDCTPIAPLGEAFQQIWFATSERAAVRQRGNAWGSVVWACKEAAHKACGGGVGFRPRSLCVTLLAPGRARVVRRPEMELPHKAAAGRGPAASWVCPSNDPQGSSSRTGRESLGRAWDAVFWRQGRHILAIAGGYKGD